MAGRRTTIVRAAKQGRPKTLEALAAMLVASIRKADAAQRPALAGRLVDTLRRIGGDDPSTLIWLRDDLAKAIDALAKVVGDTTDRGRPLGSELAPTVGQLLSVLDAIDELPATPVKQPAGVLTIDDARRLRAKRQQSASAAVADTSTGGVQRGR